MHSATAMVVSAGTEIHLTHPESLGRARHKHMGLEYKKLPHQPVYSESITISLIVGSQAEKGLSQTSVNFNGRR